MHISFLLLDSAERNAVAGMAYNGRPYGFDIRMTLGACFAQVGITAL